MMKNGSNISEKALNVFFVVHRAFDADLVGAYDQNGFDGDNH